MRIAYDPSVDALTIRLVEEPVQCEVIHLSDQVAVDIGPGERVVAIEVLDASELIPGLRERGPLGEPPCLLCLNVAAAARESVQDRVCQPSLCRLSCGG
ncbi:MAG: DUF2283 domain-containing protein [Anaerolineae bacterium]